VLEVAGMRQVSQWFGALRSEEELGAGPGFYARVMRRWASGRPCRPLPASSRLDFAFGRRLVFASLLTLAALGGYLVSHESEYPPASRRKP
jgi:hypothetical protein